MEKNYIDQFIEYNKDLDTIRNNSNKTISIEELPYINQFINIKDNNDEKNNNTITNIKTTNNLNKIAGKAVRIATLAGVVTFGSMSVIGSMHALNRDNIVSDASTYYTGNVAGDSAIQINNKKDNEYHEVISIKVIHEMKAGESISYIAEKYRINKNQIIREDGKDNNDLITVGTKISFDYNITDNKIKYATDEIDIDMIGTDNFTVIAKLYNTDIETLSRLNKRNLNPKTVLVPNFKGINEINNEYYNDYTDFNNSNNKLR